MPPEGAACPNRIRLNAARPFHLGNDLAIVLREADELGVPLNGHAPLVEEFAQQLFVVVLAKDSQGSE